MDYMSLNKELGNADLLLIDQILKGRFSPDMRILDAGCGEGRNMVYFIKNRFPIYGIDADHEAVSAARLIAHSINKRYTVENIITSTIEENPFPDEFFDVVFCINVLHFARNVDHFLEMWRSLLKITRKKGMLYLGIDYDSGKLREGMIMNPDKKDTTAGQEKLLMNEDLLNRILALHITEKNEPARFYQIEGSFIHSGMWFKKI
jgi:tellurite methyltransferase